MDVSDAHERRRRRRRKLEKSFERGDNQWSDDDAGEPRMDGEKRARGRGASDSRVYFDAEERDVDARGGAGARRG
jgi:hypothetical protein